MGKKKNNVFDDNVSENITVDKIESQCLYKYEIGDEVFTMENNRVKSFIIAKRIILTVQEDDETITKVFYDEKNWESLKAEYVEENLFPTKEDLLKTL